MQPLTDYKGNVIKEGDELVSIKVRTGQGLVPHGLYFISDDEKENVFVEYEKEPERECWEIYDSIKIEVLKGSGQLGYCKEVICGGNPKVECENLFMYLFFMESYNHIFAIKGVSDNKEMYLEWLKNKKQ